MSIEDQIRDIKKELRASMNGICSARLREAGTPYRVVFGVELPRLADIASEFTAERQLAQQLWNENIRECKILACMLMPPTDFLPEVASIWADEIATVEVAQMLAMHLLCRMPQAAELSFEWIASDQYFRQLCGFLCLARLLRQGAELNERSVLELRDQAHSLLPSADLHLQKAIHAVLEELKSEK